MDRVQNLVITVDKVKHTLNLLKRKHGKQDDINQQIKIERSECIKLNGHKDFRHEEIIPLINKIKDEKIEHIEEKKVEIQENEELQQQQQGEQDEIEKEEEEKRKEDIEDEGEVREEVKEGEKEKEKIKEEEKEKEKEEEKVEEKEKMEEEKIEEEKTDVKELFDSIFSNKSTPQKEIILDTLPEKRQYISPENCYIELNQENEVKKESIDEKVAFDDVKMEIESYNNSDKQSELNRELDMIVDLRNSIEKEERQKDKKLNYASPREILSNTMDIEKNDLSHFKFEENLNSKSSMIKSQSSVKKIEITSTKIFQNIEPDTDDTTEEKRKIKKKKPKEEILLNNQNSEKNQGINQALTPEFLYREKVQQENLANLHALSFKEEIYPNSLGIFGRSNNISSNGMPSNGMRFQNKLLNIPYPSYAKISLPNRELNVSESSAKNSISNSANEFLVNLHHSAYFPNYQMQNSQVDKIDLIESQRQTNTQLLNSPEKIFRHVKITNDIVNPPPDSINLVPLQNQRYSNGTTILQKNGEPEISETLKNNSSIKSNNPEDEKKRSSRKTLTKDKINKEIPKVKANQKSENLSYLLQAPLITVSMDQVYLYLNIN